jgi:hypothetical protein
MPHYWIGNFLIHLFGSDQTRNGNRNGIRELRCLLLPPFQFTIRFDTFRFLIFFINIDIVIHLSTKQIYIYIERSK